MKFRWQWAALLALLVVCGCESASRWLDVSKWLKKDNPKPTLFDESTDAWNGTWAEQP